MFPFSAKILYYKCVASLECLFFPHPYRHSSNLPQEWMLHYKEVDVVYRITFFIFPYYIHVKQCQDYRKKRILFIRFLPSDLHLYYSCCINIPLYSFFFHYHLLDCSSNTNTGYSYRLDFLFFPVSIAIHPAGNKLKIVKNPVCAIPPAATIPFPVSFSFSFISSRFII